MRIPTKADSIIKEIVDRLHEGYSPEKIILYGSYAYGFPRPDSDIDLLIIKETSKRFLDRCVDVRRILSDPERIVPLEIIVLTPDELSRRLEIGDQFFQEIIEKGKVVYGA